MNKQQKQIYAMVMKLPIKSGSLKLCNALIDQFLMNWNYEQSYLSDELDTIIAVKALLERFYKIRGR